VDNESTDHSPEIMKTFAEKDSRIRIITHPYCGISSARNRGLRATSGEYVLFIDSSDMIMPNSVETLYNKAEETRSDLLLGNALQYTPNAPLSVSFKRNEELNSQVGIPGEECYIKLMEVKDAFPSLVSLFFMKRELVIRNKLVFKEGIIYENELWCIKAMLAADCVTIINFNYYYSRQRVNFWMNSDNREFRIKSLLTVINEIKKLARKSKKENKSPLLIVYLYARIFKLIHFITQLELEPDSYEQLFQDSRFFSKTLLEIYQELPYVKQRECLTNYYFINSIINNRVKKCLKTWKMK